MRVSCAIGLLIFCNPIFCQTPSATPNLPSQAIFLGTTYGSSFDPSFAFLTKITSSTGGIYSFTQNIVTDINFKNASYTNHTQTGLATILKSFPKFRISIWGLAAAGVATSSTNTGGSGSLGMFGLFTPLVKYSTFKLTLGWQVVDSTISASQKTVTGGLVWTHQ